MISQQYRFHGHASVRYVLNKGKQARSKELSLKCVSNQRRRTSRIAVVVSKKVLKHAVDRNRTRRRIYEQLRLRLDKFRQIVDLVVIVYQPIDQLSPNQLGEQLDKLLVKLDVIS